MAGAATLQGDRGFDPPSVSQTFYQSDGWTRDGEQSALISGPQSLVSVNLFKRLFAAVNVHSCNLIMFSVSCFWTFC